MKTRLALTLLGFLAFSQAEAQTDGIFNGNNTG